MNWWRNPGNRWLVFLLCWFCIGMGLVILLLDD
jgi:hypothetical protein